MPYSILTALVMIRVATAAAAESTQEPAVAAADRSVPSGLGQLLVTEPQSGRQHRLPLVRYHVNVVLHPPVALVQIDQSFYNPFDRQLEGTFVFNLPREASVSRFAMFVTRTDLVEGELVERKRASDIYESIVRSMRDPAILEQLGDNLFRMRVFPIFARDTKRILLDYTVPLVPDAGRCTVEVPMLSDRDAIADFRVTGVIRGPTPIDSVSATIEPAAPVSVKERADGAIALELSERHYRPRSSLRVDFVQSAASEPVVRTYTGRSLGGERAGPTYFLATLPAGAVPGTAAMPAKQRAPADVLILAETAYAMRDRESLRQSVRSIIAGLRPDDRFTLVCGDVAARRLGDAWIEADTPQAHRALEQFAAEFFLGGADIARCVHESIRQFDQRDPNRRRLLIYLGAGLASLGETDERALIERVSRDVRSIGARFVAVRVDDVPAGHSIAETIAQETGGRVFDFHAGDMDGAGRDALNEWIESGLPSPVRVHGLRVIGARADQVFSNPSWLPGRPFDVSGRMDRAGPVTIELNTGENAGELLRWTFTLPPDGDDVLVGRHWAQRRIRHALGHGPAATDDIRAEVIRLSQEWGILTRYTAWLVLERESEYQRYGIARENRHRYWRDPDALPVRPLPESVVETAPLPVREIEPREFEQALAAARSAVKRGDGVRAQAALHSVRSSPLAAASNDFKSLEHAARSLATVQTFLQSLGAARRLVDLVPPPETEGIEPSVLPIFVAGLTSRFAQYHPHAAKLLREAEPPADRMTLRDFADWLERETGLNVVLDAPAIAEEGVRDEDALETRGLRGMSLRSVARHVLGSCNMALGEEPHRLLITTRLQEGNRLLQRIYPVVDVIQTERVPEPESLVHPYIDRERPAESRIREKLSRPISIDVSKQSLWAVADHIAELLGEPVLLDRPALEEEGVSPDRERITARWKNVPAGESLRWILEPLNLEYVVQGERIVITSAINGSNELTTRLHSIQGVVFQWPAEPLDWPAPRSNWPWNRGWGMGGLGGGVGGGMGGFAGGVGGGAGGGGGFGGSAGGGAGVGAAMGGVSIDPSDAGTLATQPPQPSGAPATPTDAPAQSTDAAQSSPTEWPAVEIDADSVVAAIEQTVLPNSWNSVGGAGSVQFWAPSLDLVVTQTASAHDQIARLLDELRRLPPVVGKRTGIVPAQPPRIGPDTPHLWDTDGLVDIIHSTVNPNCWDVVGGQCSVKVDLPRLALFVSADSVTHESLERLLLDLRRSRYFASQGTKPEYALTLDRLGVLLAGARVTQLAGNLPRELNSAATPDELALLAVRRELPGGQWRWRWAPTTVGETREFTLRRDRRRLELDTGRARVRIDGDQAAVGYPGLTLVEQGSWGEAARRVLDARLPWLPHRSNEDLARRFDIQPIESDGDTVRLRFELPRAIAKLSFDAARPNPVDRLGSPADSAANVTGHIEATFSRQSGSPIAWEAYVDGRLRLRLVFESADGRADAAVGRVRLEDAAGRVHERWELVRSEPATGPPQEVVPPLDAWPTFVQFGPQSASDRHAAELSTALTAIRAQDWPEARRQLTRVLRERPDQPLVRLMHAWSESRDPAVGSHAAAVESLRVVARSGASELIDAIGSGDFLLLSAAVRLEALVAQGESSRTALQWERLARLAAEAGRFDDAVAFVDHAIDRSHDATERVPRERLRVHLLLRLERRDEARTVADTVARDAATDAESAAALADLMFEFGEREAAELLYVRASDPRALPPQRLYEVARARARLHTRLDRWRILARAVDTLPADSPQLSEAADSLLAEIDAAADPDAAGTLASEVNGRRLRTQFRLQQARFTGDRQLAANICWELERAGELGDEVLNWAAGAMIAAGQHDRVIGMFESRLRKQAVLPHSCLQKLRTAYESTNRSLDADRAATSPWRGRSR